MTACRDPEPEAVVPPPLTGTVSISGTAAIGETLTADTESLGGKGTVSYQWKSETGNIGDNSGTYVVQAADLGATVAVTVTRAGYSGRLTSKPTAVITLPTLTGTVIIEGNFEVGQTLTANTDSLNGTGDISYQWKRNGTVNIGTNSTYTVRPADPGNTLTVTVTRSGYIGSVDSEPAALPRLTGTVTIDGIAEVGQTLTANTGGLGGTGDISYQWKRGGTGGGASVNIGTNGNTYVVQSADAGFTITVTVTRSGNSDSVSSDPTAAVTLLPLTGTVTIDGIAEVGQTLTANTGGLDGTGTISYQWMRGGTGVGADSDTYVVQYADIGSTVTVTVTRAGYSGTKTSDPTAAVTLSPLTGTVTISGTAQVGQTLTANTGSLGGTGTISYQWMRGGTGGGAAIPVGTNSRTYVVQPADASNTVSVTVTRSGNSGSVSSSAVSIRSNAYGDYVKKVEFSGSTATVTFNNLFNNNVYLVKVNRSASVAAANTTGSVQSTSPSSLSDSGLSPPLPVNTLPRKGHPAATEFNANPPPIVRETFQPLADFIPPVVGSKRTFWVEQYFNNRSWVQKPATLVATGQHGNIWVMDGETGITTMQAQALADKFDIIYPAETNLLGYEYGGGLGGTGGKDGDPKIQILVYDILEAPGRSAGVLGYFWGKDYYEQPGSGLRSNLAEIFYIDASQTRSSPTLIYSTLAHEFQHMIHFNRKTVVNGRTSAAWYNEMLSMMTEDVMADILGIPATNAAHPIQAEIPWFLGTYTEVGFSEWEPDDVTNNYSYSKGYAFGAYLMRNYGGADLLRRILANNTTDIASITAALNEIETGMTFEKAVSRFGEAMIYSGTSMPSDVFTFDKTVTRTITGYSYTLSAFNIWNTNRFSSSSYGPEVYSLTQTSMRGHSVILQQDSAWRNRSGNISITLNRPSNTNVELYLMVR